MIVLETPGPSCTWQVYFVNNIVVYDAWKGMQSTLFRTIGALKQTKMPNTLELCPFRNLTSLYLNLQ